MTEWAQVHWADARAQLQGHRQWVQSALDQAIRDIGAAISPKPTDIVVQYGTHVIPEKGLLGYATYPGRIDILIDPANEALSSPQKQPIERLIAHEAHHVARMDGPGYGTTLGEALVSEGLAGRFVHELYGPPEEPWEIAVPRDQLRNYVEEIRDGWSLPHDQDAWFFGTADKPRWLGYTYGYTLVGHYLQAHPGETAGSLCECEAEAFLPFAEL